ncbi:MAG: hypothetical protein ABI721_00905 [Candidatus Dojkabacteria bacterium]
MFSDRSKLYKEIENNTKRPLIVYVTSQRDGAVGQMAGDAINELIDQVEQIKIAGKKEIDILIESFGGDPLVSLRMMSILRENFEKVNVIIPHSAYSAATLLALGADSIIMGRYGCLGPIDPQITVKQKDGTVKQFAYEDILSFLDFTKNDAGLTEQSHLATAFKLLGESVEPSSLGFAKRSSSLSVTIGEILLKMHMGEVEGKLQAKSIAEKLNKSFFSHGHALNRKDAQALGLNIEVPSDELEKLMWDVHLDFEKELEVRIPFDPTALFLSHKDATDYLKVPAPIDIPPMQQPYSDVVINATMNFVQNQLTVTGPEVEIEIKSALIESTHFSSENYAKYRIMVVRDWNLNFNTRLVRLEGSWRKIIIKTKNASNKTRK